MTGALNFLKLQIEYRTGLSSGVVVLAIIAPVPGHEIDPLALIEFLSERLAHFMMPRYVRIMPELPKTPTNKIRKAELRASGVTADTWDGQQPGVWIRRQKLG